MTTRPTGLEELRRAAEARIPAIETSGEEDPNAVLYELHVHQVELEMQNESLADAHREGEAAYERYRDLFDFAPIGFVSIGADGRIDAANVVAAELLGLPPERLIGTRLSNFVAANEAEAFEQYRRQVIQSGQRLRTDLAFRTGVDGAPRELRLESSCTNATTEEWRTALLDVTEVRRLERAEAHSGRLDEVTRHAASVTHDLTNMLSGVLGFASVALNALPRDPGAARLAVERLRQVSLRGVAMLRHLSLYSRLGEDPVSVVDVNEFIAMGAPLLSSLLTESSTIQTHLLASDPLVRASPDRIERILLNLVTNSAHAMPRGGIVTIVTEDVDLGAEQDGVSLSYVRVTVADTGSGMNEATVAHAFDPFFTTKPSGRGTGLGLPLVRQMVEECGGYVTLTSALGRGTEISLYFPRAVASARTQSERPHAPDGHDGAV